VAHDVFVNYSHHDKPEADAVCAEWGAAIVDAIQSPNFCGRVTGQHTTSQTIGLPLWRPRFRLRQRTDLVPHGL
jgi:hypothetical protein